MFVQYVTFCLDGLEVDSYLALCDEVAPAYAGIDGCLGKLFIRHPETAAGFGGSTSGRPVSRPQHANTCPACFPRAHTSNRHEDDNM